MCKGWKGASLGVQGKICPHCHQKSFSAVTMTRVWTCPYCGREFLAVEGKEQGQFLEGAKGEGDALTGDRGTR